MYLEEHNAATQSVFSVELIEQFQKEMSEHLVFTVTKQQPEWYWQN